MSVTLETIPQVGHLEVDIKVRAEVNVSAFAARQKVNAFVLSEISYLMHADVPTLVFAERIYWRVPILLSLPTQGVVGSVGYLDVDIETGQIQCSPTELSEIEARAEAVVKRTAPATAV
jgi:hypothetical protein